MNDEKQLKYLQSYSRSNCEIECMSMLTLRKCDCVQFFMPRDQDTKICGVADEKCFRNVENSFMDLKKECECLESCDLLTYELNVLDLGFT